MLALKLWPSKGQSMTKNITNRRLNILANILLANTKILKQYETHSRYVRGHCESLLSTLILVVVY